MIAEDRGLCFLPLNHVFAGIRSDPLARPSGVVEVRIADDNGKSITQGGEGEILIRGPNVMG